MRVSFFTAGLFTIAALCAASAVAVIWRETTESGLPKPATITAYFVAQCQMEKPECADMVTGAMRWDVNAKGLSRTCLAKRPSARTMARDTVIWLNAHTELHPLPVEQGIAKAAEAIWPCKKSGA
ncbi:MAG TPA: hypothetical protein VG274_04000 [Rhizomicrobium sp.]|jgi:hypothetical protein|nr:hypothetical protein [Rhizomicrobium sp.]